MKPHSTRDTPGTHRQAQRGSVGLTCMKRVNTGVLARRASCSCAAMLSAGRHGTCAEWPRSLGIRQGAPKNPKASCHPS